jgi:hypothetical protein
MQIRRIIVSILVIAGLLVPAARSEAARLCGWECNLQGLNICVFSDNRGYRCWQLQGGCISGLSAECYDEWPL